MPYTRPGGQKYIYISFIDGERVLKRLVPLNMKRVQQGKLMFLPLFKDQQQITKFRRILALTHLDPLLQYLTTLFQRMAFRVNIMLMTSNKKGSVLVILHLTLTAWG